MPLPSWLGGQGAGKRAGALPVAMAVLGFAVTGAAIRAQQIQIEGSPAPALGPVNRGVQADAARLSHVSLVSDALEVEAGKPQVPEVVFRVELVFRVDPGFHINSHVPKDDLLIPTVFRLDRAGTKLLSESYPAGTPFRLGLPGDSSTGEVLDVYQGEFRVALRVAAPRGASTLTGNLHYQACDNAACFPAKTLPVTLGLRGR